VRFTVAGRKGTGIAMSFVGSVLDLRLKSVLLATDLSPAFVKPLHHALAIARHYRAKLYVAHVVSPIPYLMAGPEALEPGCEGGSRDLQTFERESVHDGSLDGVDREFIMRRGGVWEELQEIIFQKQIDLVVVGTHGRRGIEKLLLGSVAERVFRHADCPVLTVGPHSYLEGRVEWNGTQTYLFATDFGEPSLGALPHAVSLAKGTKAKLVLVHVVPAPPIPQIPGWYNASEVISVRENARAACLRRLEQLLPRDEQRPIDNQFVVQFGTPSEKILQVALERRADLLILGLRRSPLPGTISHIPWATAYEIVCGAACPVLTVRR
jgi:nucleotide-binding universal stress UspA family protein